MIDLSILVCSVLNRHDTFLPKIQKQLHDQYEALIPEDKERVEIVTLIDNKKMMLGHKRNNMVEMAQGEYVQFVDDDDRIAPDFIKQLLDAIEKSHADVIVFQAEVTIGTQKPKLCYYSIENRRDYNTKEAFYRIPNHICCVKKKLSLKSSFPHIMYGEDAGYSKLLLKHLKTEHVIDKIMYYYDYNPNTSETQQHQPNRVVVAKREPIVDVVFLSKATTPLERSMTQKAIDSCINGANGLPINVIVLEQGAAAYGGVRTINKRKEKFNYNKFANDGAELGKSEWIMISNNDVTFEDGWLHYLLAADYPIVSPHEPDDPRQKQMKDNESGYENGRHLSGWCFMIKRDLWYDIGKFDDCVDFWCSDDVVIEQLKEQDIPPMVVKKSIVHHQVSKTLRTLPPVEKEGLMWKNVEIFNRNYNRDKFVNDPRYVLWLETKKAKEL